MVYRVVLLQSNIRCRHSWHYSCLQDALEQFNRLAIAYEDVNDVQPLLFKTTPADATTSMYSLLTNLLPYA